MADLTPEQRALRDRIIPAKEAYEKALLEHGDCGPWVRGSGITAEVAFCAVCDGNCGMWCEKAPDNLCFFEAVGPGWTCRHCGRDGTRA